MLRKNPTVLRIYIDLFDTDALSRNKILFPILLAKPEKRFSKKHKHIINLADGRRVELTLSHTLLKVEHDHATEFEIIDKESEFKDKKWVDKNILVKSNLGKIQKSAYIIQVAHDGNINLIPTDRLDKKQKKKKEEDVKDFIERVRAETTLAKILYFPHPVGKPLVYTITTTLPKKDNKKTYSRTSFPYLGEPLDKTQVHSLPLGNLMNMVVGLYQQLKNFHDSGFAHRDIKPANTAYASKQATLTLLHPGFAKFDNAKEEIRDPSVYLHKDFLKLEELHDAQKGDVYSLAFVTGIIFGLTPDYLSDCFNRNEKPDFNRITSINDAEYKKALVYLLEQMTEDNLEKIPSLDVCLATLMDIQKKIYVSALTKIETTLDVASNIICADLKTRASHQTDIKKIPFTSIQQKLKNLKDTIAAEKLHAPDVLAEKGADQVAGVNSSRIIADYKKIQHEMNNIRLELKKEIFKREQGNWFRKKILNNLARCFCFGLFSAPKSAVTASRARHVLKEAIISDSGLYQKISFSK